MVLASRPGRAAQFGYLEEAMVKLPLTGVGDDQAAGWLVIRDFCAGRPDAHRNLGRWRRFAGAN
jgi:hypothetical protein